MNISKQKLSFSEKSNASLDKKQSALNYNILQVLNP